MRTPSFHADDGIYAFLSVYSATISHGVRGVAIRHTAVLRITSILTYISIPNAAGFYNTRGRFCAVAEMSKPVEKRPILPLFKKLRLMSPHLAVARRYSAGNTGSYRRPADVHPALKLRFTMW